MALSKEEREAAVAEARRAEARAKESDEQKWMRTAIREELSDLIDEKFAAEPEGGKPSGAAGFFESLGLGKKSA